MEDCLDSFLCKNHHTALALYINHNHDVWMLHSMSQYYYGFSSFMYNIIRRSCYITDLKLFLTADELELIVSLSFKLIQSYLPPKKIDDDFLLLSCIHDFKSTNCFCLWTIFYYVYLSMYDSIFRHWFLLGQTLKRISLFKILMSLYKIEMNDLLKIFIDEYI